MVAVFALFVLGSVMGAQWGYGKISREVENIQRAYEVTQTTGRIQQALTEAQGIERTFLVAPTPEAGGVFRKTLQQAQTGVESLKAFGLNEAFSTSVAELAENVRDYGKEFDWVYSNQKSMGFGLDQGYQGMFKESAESLEQAFLELNKPAMITRLHEIRMAEKDFFLGRLSAGMEVKQGMQELRDQLTKVKGADALTRPAGVIDGYLTNFDRVRLYTYKNRDLAEKFTKEFTKIPQHLEELNQAALEEQGLVSRNAQEVTRSLGRSFLVFGVMILGLVGLLGWGLSRSILMPIKAVFGLTQELSKGNLTHKIKTGGLDELGQMSKSLNRFTFSLKKTIGVIHHSSHTLSAASLQLSATTRQIDSTTKEVNVRSGHSNKSLQEVSKNVQELSVSNEEITLSVRNLLTTTNQVAQEAAQGQVTLDRLTQAMEEIEGATAKIGGFLATLDQLSKRVNLLSFNAAIEAAKAGEAGLGFNVVAGEVRRLSEHTKEALSGIEGLVQEAQSKVAQGRKVVGQSADQFLSIATEVNTINQGLNRIAGEIITQDYKTKSLAQETDKVSHWVEESSVTLTELALSVAQVDLTTGELSGMAGELQSRVKVFQI
ncbi:MAG: hypothetical protein A2600_04960 [Candidatus Lambdaproteobacteria bacterium RIFOXYD1_FULL_56_27]|uniref:Methyl-accepting chemotaxis protein n=1 Tax=Candidatus Lambdaproteobacteria bacterium RIFOXYD2_FULL_56_26 TaxID=1817773 RepID=A0A1F6GRR4_9PROT|nr:MAG: hypothetical protein A2426_07815 [Candidatus Lambdaproteobacteria bacterium RIFOXYC1_FULL_56_13]OGH00832.1 MAG: hypothetical protein A2557_03925 [Candidatus Lambdaproteobacteria bacterium RIFOXYD2_FULL_56_26]OGH09903.1 MAG: hypothetical protein A2600_04960 [Candidatus Lambdaproteobacteria bacterium RIFOXYD1_FULL_56_27]